MNKKTVKRPDEEDPLAEAIDGYDYFLWSKKAKWRTNHIKNLKALLKKNRKQAAKQLDLYVNSAIDNLKYDREELEDILTY
jgi:hypothetical protein